MIDHTIFNWIQLVKKDATIPSVAKHLCHYLSTFMNMEQNVAWPSLARIQHETGYGHATVLKYLAWLDEHGWLERESGNSKKTTRYLTTIPNKTVEQITGDGRSRADLGRSRADLGVGREPTTNNTNINKPMNNMRKSAIPFLDFWNQYPKKVDKKRAERTWNRLPIEKQKKAITDCATRFLETERQYIPAPTTYLNGERWEDERIGVNQGGYGMGGI